jgi:O-antigen/teichoic acid export membrane protein
MLGPVLQARLVPSVSAILSREEFPTLGKLIGKGLRGLIIGGALFVTGFALFGDTVIDILFGGNTTLDHLDLALLAIPTFLYLLALLLPSEAILKVEVAGVIAMSTVVILLFSQLSRAMKSGLASNTIKS